MRSRSLRLHVLTRMLLSPGKPRKEAKPSNSVSAGATWPPLQLLASASFLLRTKMLSTSHTNVLAFDIKSHNLRL